MGQAYRLCDAIFTPCDRPVIRLQSAVSANGAFDFPHRAFVGTSRSAKIGSRSSFNIAFARAEATAGAYPGGESFHNWCWQKY